MTEASNEALLMSLLEQIRSLEDERDKAIELANGLNHKLTEHKKEAKTSQQCSPGDVEQLETQNKKLRQTVGTLTETLVAGLEEIRLNEEQRQYNLRELRKREPREQDDEEMDLESCKTMLEMCKKYYGKLVSDLQEDKNSLQQKLSHQQNVLLEKDMKIAELEMRLEQKK